jgi:hypothetical protein
LRAVRFHSLRVLAVVCWVVTSAVPGAFAIGRYDARNGDECRAQVIANYNALAARAAAAGNTRAIASHWNRWAVPELEQCEQMDQAVRNTRMQAAHARLTAAITTLRQDGLVRDEEKRWLQQERDAIAEFPHAPYRDAVLALHADFLRYATTAPAAGGCESIRRALKSARVEHDGAVDALIARTPDWRVNEQVRQAALAEMQFQRYQAQRAGCATP